MSRLCEFCGGPIEEFTHTRNHVWVACRHCQRSWREDLAAIAAPTNRSETPPRSPAPFLESGIGRYLAAAAAVGVAFGVRLAVKPLLGNASPFLFFTPAVMVAAWLGGIGPAIAAAGAGAALGNQFFLPTIGGPILDRWDRVAMFLLVGGLIIGLTTVVKTSRRRLDEGLWREQKLRAEAEAANQTKDDFLAMVSHELQTPVAVVLGWAAATRRRQLHGEALTVALEAIERNARIQSRLVQDILDRTRIVTGQLRLDPQVVSITEILRAAVEQMRPVFDRNHVHVRTAIEDAPYPTSADPVRLQQVFTNLLSNAAKFTRPGGHVAVEASSTAGFATVTIKDDGIGISRDFLPHVFDGFQRDPRTVAATAHGLGLGLSIAKHFVERHGGTIQADSDGPGKGAVFTVVLPLHPPATAPAAESRPNAAAAGALRAMSVLLVEDDDDARRLLTETLEYYGAHVLPVSSAADAIHMLEQHHADVLLSDLRMPGEDGFALIHHLRSLGDPDVASIPAAAITASRKTEDRHHAIAAGYQLQLQKPIDPDELVSAILTLANMLRKPPERMH